MKRIIEIDENLICEGFVRNFTEEEKDVLIRAVRNSTPLPKGHGRLIDAEKLANYVNDLKDGWNRYGNEYESGRYESYDFVLDVIEDAPTIIEADKEAENEHL